MFAWGHLVFASAGWCGSGAKPEISSPKISAQQEFEMKKYVLLASGAVVFTAVAALYGFEPRVGGAPNASAVSQPLAGDHALHTAMIDDRLGFVGVRSGPGSEMPVVGRLYGADIFAVEPAEGDWWRVRHADGAVTGWIPRERIELVDLGGQDIL